MTDEPDQLRNLVEIRPGILAGDEIALDQSPVEVRGLRGNRCQHLKLVLDLEARTVHCRTCNAVVDPFDYLASHGDRWSTIAGWVRRAKEERTRVEQEVRGLKAEKKRLQDAIRRAGKRVAATERTGRRNRKGEP